MFEEQEKELRKLYERYKLQWMLYHDLGLTDLIKALEIMIHEDEQSGDVRRKLQELFEAWEFGVGFAGGQMWACFEEFEMNEFQESLTQSGFWEPKLTSERSNHE